MKFAVSAPAGFELVIEVDRFGCGPRRPGDGHYTPGLITRPIVAFIYNDDYPDAPPEVCTHEGIFMPYTGHDTINTPEPVFA